MQECENARMIQGIVTKNWSIVFIKANEAL